jgi:hypothetical protein
MSSDWPVNGVVGKIMCVEDEAGVLFDLVMVLDDDTKGTITLVKPDVVD